MLSDVLASWPGLPSPTPLPTETVEYLRRYLVPEDIIDDLAKCCFPRWLAVGPLDLVPMVALVEQTSGIIECFEHGYVVIAGCRNFDPVAVDIRTRRMVFVCHDELPGGDEQTRFEDCLRPTPLRYEQFWEAVASDPDFPSDSYEAGNRWPAGHNAI